MVPTAILAVLFAIAAAAAACGNDTDDVDSLKDDSAGTPTLTRTAGNPTVTTLSAATQTPAAAAPTPTLPASAPTEAPPDPTPRADAVAVDGVFSVIYGDPPPGSGESGKTDYVLSDESGKQWTLIFDSSVYTPPGGAFSYSGKQVRVEGRRTAPNTILVESLQTL